MSGHTPGPWTATSGDHTHRFVRVADADERTIFYKYGAGTSKEADQDEANARLIAAAPELLEALRWFIDDIDGSHTVMVEFDANVKRARAVIAKATAEATS